MTPAACGILTAAACGVVMSARMEKFARAVTEPSVALTDGEKMSPQGTKGDNSSIFQFLIKKRFFSRRCGFRMTTWEQFLNFQFYIFNF